MCTHYDSLTFDDWDTISISDDDGMKPIDPETGIKKQTILYDVSYSQQNVTIVVKKEYCVPVYTINTKLAVLSFRSYA